MLEGGAPVLPRCSAGACFMPGTGRGGSLSPAGILSYPQVLRATLLFSHNTAMVASAPESR